MPEGSRSRKSSTLMYVVGGIIVIAGSFWGVTKLLDYESATSPEAKPPTTESASTSSEASATSAADHANAPPADSSAAARTAMSSSSTSANEDSEYKRAFIDGQTVIATLDVCSGSIGTIACGRDYKIKFVKRDEQWCDTATGWQNQQQEVISHETCGSDPTTNGFGLFGAFFSYNSKGEVFHIDKLVGHLKLSENSQNPEQ